MQTIVIAVLIVIAGLIGAILACATSLINRVRAANITLRRIEEALLSLNRVKAIDSAIKSAEPVEQSPAVDAGSVGFRTLRELRMMSGRDRHSADSVPNPNGRKPLRTSAPTSSNSDLPGVIAREGALAVHSAKVAAYTAVVSAPNTEATSATNTAVGTREPTLEASESHNGLDSGFAISRQKPDQQTLSMDFRMGADDGVVHQSQVVVTAVAQKVPTANGELPIQKATEAVEEAPLAISPAIREMPPEVSTSTGDMLSKANESTTVESAVGREVPEVGQGGETAPASNALDDVRRKKKEQETLMIISSRRRRARAGR